MIGRLLTELVQVFVRVRSLKCEKKDEELKSGEAQYIYSRGTCYAISTGASQVKEANQRTVLPKELFVDSTSIIIRLYSIDYYHAIVCNPTVQFRVLCSETPCREYWGYLQADMDGLLDCWRCHGGR
jgi:hypothetical protein